MAQEAKAEKKAQKKKKQDEEDEAHAKAVAAMSKNWFLISLLKPLALLLVFCLSLQYSLISN